VKALTQALVLTLSIVANPKQFLTNGKKSKTLHKVILNRNQFGNTEDFGYPYPVRTCVVKLGDVKGSQGVASMTAAYC